LDRCGFASQHQKRGLKGILGIVRVPQQAIANPQNHWPVPAHQRREGVFFLPSDKAL